MSMLSKLEKQIQAAIDSVFTLLPQPVPDKSLLERCRIVSHRGEHDNRIIFENTIPAFQQALAKGIWGIEFDIRWTKDLHPVICHDADLQRVFGDASRVSGLTRSELQQVCPLVPGLEEVIDTFGGKLHFMVEIKKERYPDPDYQNQVLKDHFAPLTPGRDFHIVSLAPEMLQVINFTVKSSFLLIAEWNIRHLSALAMQNGYGGLNGHYLLFTHALLQKHKRMGQNVGTGYVASKNALFRELNRGVDYIFSNNAADIQAIRNKALDAL